MQIKETQSSGLKHEFHIVVPAEYIEKKMESRLMKVGKKAKIPGFRPGKVPLSILKQHYGSSVLSEVLESVVQDVSKKVIEDNKLRPALNPDFEVKSFEQGKELVLGMTVENLPEIAIPALDKLAFERLKSKIAKKDVDEALEQFALYVGSNNKSIEGNRKTKKDDIVVINFSGTIDGKPIEGGSDKDFPLTLGSNSFIPGFEDQLIGKNKGDHVHVHVSFPEDYSEKKLAGKPAVFEVDILDIQEKASPKVDDELAKKMGFETLDECRTAIESNLRGQYDSMAFTQVKRHVLDALEGLCTFEIPGKMVDMEFEAIWKQLLREMGVDQADGDNHAANNNAEGRVGAKTFEEASGKTEAELRDEYRHIADRRVRLGLLLAEIGRQEKVVVSNEELAQSLFATARKYPGQERQVIDYYRSNENAMASLRAPIFENKVIEFILSKAKVSDKEISIEEIQKLASMEDELDAKPKKAAKAKKADKTAEGEKPAKKATKKKES